MDSSFSKNIFMVFMIFVVLYFSYFGIVAVNEYKAKINSSYSNYQKDI